MSGTVPCSDFCRLTPDALFLKKMKNRPKRDSSWKAGDPMNLLTRAAAAGAEDGAAHVQWASNLTDPAAATSRREKAEKRYSLASALPENWKAHGKPEKLRARRFPAPPQAERPLTERSTGAKSPLRRRSLTPPSRQKSPPNHLEVASRTHVAPSRELQSPTGRHSPPSRLHSPPRSLSRSPPKSRGIAEARLDTAVKIGASRWPHDPRLLVEEIAGLRAEVVTLKRDLSQERTKSAAGAAAAQAAALGASREREVMAAEMVAIVQMLQKDAELILQHGRRADEECVAAPPPSAVEIYEEDEEVTLRHGRPTKLVEAEAGEQDAAGAALGDKAHPRVRPRALAPTAAATPPRRDDEVASGSGVQVDDLRRASEVTTSPDPPPYDEHGEPTTTPRGALYRRFVSRPAIAAHQRPSSAPPTTAPPVWAPPRLTSTRSATQLAATRQRAMSHWRGRRLAFGMAAWTRWARHDREPRQRALSYSDGRRLSIGWAAWARAHAKRRRVAGLLSHSLRYWTDHLSVRGWHGWVDAHAATVRGLSLLRHAALHVMHAAAARGLRSWVEYRDIRARKERLLRSGLRFFLHRQLALGFAAWSHSAFQEAASDDERGDDKLSDGDGGGFGRTTMPRRRRLRHSVSSEMLILIAVRYRMRIAMVRGCRAWAAQARERARRASMLRLAITRLMRRDTSRALRSWMEGIKPMHPNDVAAMRRGTTAWRHRRVVFAWRSWVSFSEARAHRLALSRKVIAHIIHRSQAKALHL